MKQYEYKILKEFDVSEEVLTDNGLRGWRLIKVTQPIFNDMTDVVRLYIMEREII